MNKSGYESFVFYETFEPTLDILDDKTALKMHRAIMKYGLHGTMPNFDDVKDMGMFLLFKKDIDLNQERRQKQKENGKKGGRKKTDEETQEQILEDLASGMKQEDIAEKNGVSQGTVSNIKNEVFNNINNANIKNSKNIKNLYEDEDEDEDEDNISSSELEVRTNRPSPAPDDLSFPTQNNQQTTNDEHINQNEKQTPQEPVPKQQDEEAQRLAHKLLTLHKKLVDPGFNRTQAQLDIWAKDIELLHRIDGRSYEDIERAMEWAKNDSFWSANIISGQKFRKQYPQLLGKMQNARPRASPTQMQASSTYDYSKALQAMQIGGA